MQVLERKVEKIVEKMAKFLLEKVSLAKFVFAPFGDWVGWPILAALTSPSLRAAGRGLPHDVFGARGQEGRTDQVPRRARYCDDGEVLARERGRQFQDAGAGREKEGGALTDWNFCSRSRVHTQRVSEELTGGPNRQTGYSLLT